MELKEITCIVCPLGCRIQVEMERGEIKSVKGYSCSRGLEYAKNEVTMPKRTITTSVRAIGGHLPLLSVRTKEPVPKEKIQEIMLELAKVEVKAPVKIGDVVVKNILGTGVDIIATRNLYVK
ncbi:Uncharacterized protein with conserved CXXC pairs [Thermoanaerobacter thermohydrosulfuricus WC1]|uniref:Uncharacterized protein with conserved CXXC pairs n=1 Tax=Thermoanaerobacter thermohydrosulfuricus WC1 TaxID=1198630 RepID=M8CPP4_THETY|nr:DUF1667 domain-containing protein [Thermoanaerobacter thermohydrosulfuricus]EMT39115.1 Uncharacterized protein with conserved CXXC pairs [Thermoanaerobacter thermohydrosulfuricus WC1]